MQYVDRGVRVRPRWHPSALIMASLAVHAIALALLLAHPDEWRSVLGVLVANHLVLGLAGLVPSCDWLGPNWARLPAAAAARGEVALTIDDGPDPDVTPQVLDLLDLHGAKATFFCIGDAARQHPALTREIVRRGHAVENHSQSHCMHFAAFGPWRMAADIDRSQATLATITGERPRFFRPTAGLRSVFLDPVLARRGLQLASWTRRGFDTRETRPDVVFHRLVRGLRAGDILLLHDRNVARTAAGAPVILEVLPPLLAALRAAGLHPVTLRSAQR